MLTERRGGREAGRWERKDGNKFFCNRVVAVRSQFGALGTFLIFVGCSPLDLLYLLHVYQTIEYRISLVYEC